MLDVGRMTGATALDVLCEAGEWVCPDWLGDAKDEEDEVCDGRKGCWRKHHCWCSDVVV